MRHLVALAFLLITAGLGAHGCKSSTAAGGGGANGQSSLLQPVNLTDAPNSDAPKQGVTLSAAQNEWTNFTLRLAIAPGSRYALRIHPLKSQEGKTIEPGLFEAYHVVNMPIDVNRAGYVRHTGENAGNTELPRALLPIVGSDGLLNLRTLRPAPGAADDKGPVNLWIDLRIPEECTPGKYTGRCELIRSEKDAGEVVATVPIELTVHNFVLPKVRNLQVAGQIDWETLERLYPDRFETVRARLLNRRDEKYGPTVRVLDQIVALAQKHRTSVFVPSLHPTVKWTLTEPQVDWTDFDELVNPWLTGDAFADKIPVGFWPLPSAEGLSSYRAQDQKQYWLNAATHFDQHQWLERAPIWLKQERPGPIRPIDTIELSSRAAELMQLHRRASVMLPLENDQVQLANPQAPRMINPLATNRLLAAAPGLVFASLAQDWPLEVSKPRQWLRTDTPGLVPYAGAGGGVKDVRLWAWLAFLRQAELIVFHNVLPTLSDPSQPADPNELIWFYPGEWFGLTEPVPTVQLKWLRRAQQDFEYLRLAKVHGGQIRALVVARLMTKPVEILPVQQPDPTYALMTGTPQTESWEGAQSLLAEMIELQKVEPSAQERAAFENKLLQWMRPQEQPLLMGRATKWHWEAPPGQQRPAGRIVERAGGGVGPDIGGRLHLWLGIDIYNASDATPDGELQWRTVPSGWEVRPFPIDVPALKVYHVRREVMEANFDLSKLSSGARGPMNIVFTNKFDRRETPLNLSIPVAASERVEGRPLLVDGDLKEWESDDLIQDGPMVRMLDRPGVRSHALAKAQTPAKVFTSWADKHFYLAFDLKGISRDKLLNNVQNFVDYQFRRAWGEDLTETLIQAVYADGSVGPVLHVVCKPTGSWAERKLDPREHANPWLPFEGAGIRYKATLNNDRWTGEVSIPWEVIQKEGKGMPKLLRFNFSQHRTGTGESASWAGPVDFGRDDSFTGVLYLREVEPRGLAGRNRPY